MKTNGCAVTTSPLALRKFPAKIRENIFQFCVRIKDQKSPALLIALRGDKEMYQEAINLYYKVNLFTVSNDTVDRCTSLSVKALMSISKLEMK
jgi:hypothetical protein